MAAMRPQEKAVALDHLKCFPLSRWERVGEGEREGEPNHKGPHPNPLPEGEGEIREPCPLTSRGRLVRRVRHRYSRKLAFEETDDAAGRGQCSQAVPPG